MSVYLVPSPCGSHTCVAPEPERPLNLTVGEGTAVVEVFDDGRPSHQLQPGHGPTKIQNGPVDEVFRPGQDPHARGHRVLETSPTHTQREHLFGWRGEVLDDPQFRGPACGHGPGPSQEDGKLPSNTCVRSEERRVGQECRS